MPRIAPDTFTNYVERSGPLTLRVSSWLGGTRLPLDGRDRIPVVAQSWEISDAADAKTSGEITFEVPNTPAFWPTTDDHPLAANGQRLWAQVGYGSERVSAGWFRILDEPEDNGPTLRVSAKGLSHEIARARFLRPYQSPAGATRLGELRKLVAPIPVVLDAGLSDKVLPIYTQDEDRTQAIVDITDTWPARWYIGDDAALHVGPVWDDANPGAPTFTLTGGPGGGLVKLTPRQLNPDPFNGYRVSNVPEGDVAEVVGTWVVPSGPLRWSEPSGMPGPYGQKPGFYASSLLPADEATLVNVARNMTERGLRRKWAAQGVARPDPRLVIGDVGMAASDRVGIASLVRLTGYRLTPRDMAVDVALLGEVAA